MKSAAAGPIAAKRVEASDVVDRYRARLANFIRRRVPDRFDAEDVLQDVFYRFAESGENTYSIEQIGAWLFTVARNRIVDLFRKKKPQRFSDFATAGGEESAAFEDLLPSPEAGPEAQYARRLLVEELIAAISELPEDQRRVFIAHGIEGRSFKELAADTGVSVSTLISRKHYAVEKLRERLEDIYEDLYKEFPGS